MWTSARGDAADQKDTIVPADNRIAVVWDDVERESGLLASFTANSPWSLAADPVEVGRRAVLRSTVGRIYVVSSLDDNITVVSRDTWEIQRTYSLTS